MATATANKEIVLTLKLNEAEAKYLLALLQNPLECTNRALKEETEEARLKRINLFNPLKFALDNPE